MESQLSFTVDKPRPRVLTVRDQCFSVSGVEIRSLQAHLGTPSTPRLSHEIVALVDQKFP